MCKKHITVLLGALLAFSNIPCAVFSQSNPSNDGVPMGWTDKMDLTVGYKWEQQVQSSTSITYGFKYESHYQETWDVILDINGGYGRTKNEKIRDDHKLDLKTDRWIMHSAWSISYIGYIESNQIQGIYFLAKTGGGLKYRPVRLWWMELSFSSQPVVSHKRPWQVSTPDGIENPDETTFRILNNAECKFNFTEDRGSGEKSLLFSFQYEPNAMRFREYTAQFIATLTIQIFGNLNLMTSYHWNFNSEPVQGQDIPKVTQFIESGVTLNLSFN